MSVDISSSKPLSGLRILIAEDESLIAFELESTLQDLGCDIVGPVSSVAEVVEKVEEGGVDGALLDINLRGEQIFSVLPKLVDRNLPIIFTSGYNDPKFFPPAFRSRPRIAKPIDSNELQALCLKVFGSS